MSIVSDVGLRRCLIYFILNILQLHCLVIDEICLSKVKLDSNITPKVVIVVLMGMSLFAILIFLMGGVV